MKKIFTTAAIIAALTVPMAGVFAEDAAPAANDVKEIVPISDEVPVTDEYVMNKHIGVVESFDKNYLAVKIDDVSVTFVVADVTPIIDLKTQADAEIKAGDKVIVFSESGLMTKDIKSAKAVVVGSEEEESISSMVSLFDKGDFGLTSADGELVVNVENDAEYVGKELLIIYNMATMSLPPQTSPLKVIVLGADEESATAAPTAAPTDAPVDVERPTEVPTEKAVEIGFKVGDSVLKINDKDIEVEAPYVVGGGVTLVPVRVISEAFGSEVKWDDSAKKAELTYGETVIELTVGDKSAVVDGDMVMELEEAPELSEAGYAMVPLRFISETFGATVSYDEADRSIKVVK